MSKILVIGGGPAGMMAAIMAAKNNEVILIEKNKDLGKKLKITGGGRCNITNMRDINDFFEKIVRNPKFLYSSFYTFTNLDLLDIFKNNNIDVKVEEDLKVYPVSDKSEEIINYFRNELIKSNVKIIYEKEVTDFMIEDNEIKGVILNDNEKINGEKVIVATGGKSYPKTGSDGKLYEICEKYGHNISAIYPALVPLIVKEDFIKNMQGISMRNVVVSTKIKNKKIEIIGDILFAHFGITGPAILNMSSHINRLLQKEEVVLNIDFVPNISSEEISKIIRENPNKAIYNNLKDILQLNFIKEILHFLNIDKKPNELTKEEERKIIESLKSFKLTVTNTKSVQEGIITSGGINTKDINSSTMESKIIRNLYFAGEIIDIEGVTGGYNLQIAFSTGYLAGINV